MARVQRRVQARRPQSQVPSTASPGAVQVFSCALLKDGSYFTAGETEARTETYPPRVLRPGRSKAGTGTQARLSPEKTGRGRLQQSQPPRLDPFESEDVAGPCPRWVRPGLLFLGLRPEPQRWF